MTNAIALELHGIVKRFGDVAALDDASLSVRAGSVHALLGENGAGKTTLMRIAYGMLRPESGVVSVGGNVRTFASPSDAIASGVGMVQQHPSNVPAMTVWENVQLGGRGVLRPAAARKEVAHLAKTLGFPLEADARVADLSVASQQRLDILKAVGRKARILILDEPTAILAPEEAADLYRWLRSFAEEGGTAVVITHKLAEARNHTDELTVLRGGRTVMTGSSAGFSAEALTTAMIGGSVAVDAPPTTGGPGAVVFRASRVSVRDPRGLMAVKDASFEVRAGEVVGVAGVENSGHHELLLAIANRRQIASGTVDRPANVALVPEDRHRDGIVGAFSITENVAIRNAGARSGRIHWNALGSSVADLIRTFDVRARGPRDVLDTLSGGNQQKVVVARELADEPALIVMENPTRGLDVRASAFVREQLRAARARGAAVVFYSSDLDEVLDLADRVLVVHAGTVTAVPRDRKRIGAAMLGAA